MKLKHPLLFLALFALMALLLSPSAGHADTILRSAGDFTLLGGTAITNAGVVGTVISNGSVGLSPNPTTGITGLSAAELGTGAAIIPTGPVTGQARLDLIDAQVGLAGLPSKANMSTVDLGGKTLEPGVYTFDTTAMLTGNLVLDGKGRNNAVWVFQIGTALTTSVNSTVKVINTGSNGGSDYGIFWNCGSAVTIGANNEIVGNYLAGTSITFGTGSFGSGRALALAAITLENNQIDAFGGPGGSDWSGGLMLDRSGRVAPLEDLSFDYPGRKKSVTTRSKVVMRGSASAGAAVIQWRTNTGKWRNVKVTENGSWTVKIAPLQVGRNRLRLRARDAEGGTTAVRHITIKRVANACGILR